MRSVWFLVTGLVIAGGLALGVGSQPSEASSSLQTDAEAEPALPPMHPHGDMGMPGPSKSEPSDKTTVIDGTVREVLQVERYTYLRLDRAGRGETWAAVPTSAPAIGSRVRIQGAIELANFNSPTLSRTFEVIYFGTLAPVGKEADAAAVPRASTPHGASPSPHGPVPPGHPGGG
jgi:hypothetical protein